MSSSRIVLIVPNWLGDAVMALPALARIRASRPADTILVAGRASTAALFSMVPGVSEWVRLDSRGGMLGAISWAEDAAALRAVQAELAVLLPNSFRSAWTAHRAGIPERWGYASDLRGRLLTRKVARLRGRFHQAEYYLHLADALGFTTDAGGQASLPAPAEAGQASVPARVDHASRLPPVPKLVAPAEARARADDLLARLGVAPGALLVGLAPGAAYGKAKQWPPDYYASLAAQLHQQLGATCLVFGARADAQVSGVVCRQTLREVQTCKNDGSGAGSAAIVDLAGQTDLPLLVALMTRCRAVVANDSGAMHVAAAAGVPVTAVFGASDERGTAPLSCDERQAASHTILTSPVWCRPCMLRECPIDHRCMRSVRPAVVAHAVARQAERIEK